MMNQTATILALAVERLQAALYRIQDEADFSPDDGAMELGERLLRIGREARDALDAHD